MNTLFLTDGSSMQIPESRFIKFMTMLTHRGIKSVRFDNQVVIVSPSNLIRIELGVEDESDERETVEQVAVPEVAQGTEDGEGDATESGKDEPVAEEKPESIADRKKRLRAEMIEKSNCAPTHEGREQILHYQMVNAGGSIKKGKKGLPGKRFFNICSFCGLKQRFIKADTLTDENKENAVLWVKEDN